MAPKDSTIVFQILDGKERPLSGALVQGDGPRLGHWQMFSNEWGYCFPILSPDDYKITVSSQGYATRELDAHIDGPGEPIRIGLERSGVVWPPSPGIPGGGSDFDPSGIPLEELANIRGAMWTARAPLPFGPRPNAPTNIVALEYIHSYHEAGPEVAELAIQTYLEKNYTHCCYGPPNAQSYHGQYPDIDFRINFERFLDWLQYFWNRGLRPIVFMGFDGATLEEMKAFYEPRVRDNPKAQRLMRIVVPHGWEPRRYADSSWTWAEWGKWVADLLPNSLRLIHMEADQDAPAGADSRGDDDAYSKAHGGGNGFAWQRVAPYYHGTIFQFGGYVFMKDSAGRDMEHNSPEFPAKYQEWLKNLGDYFRDARRRFEDGYAGWPTGSAFGPDIPMIRWAGEYGAYAQYWKDWPESESIESGNVAKANGARGYLDGGSVNVP